METPSKKEVWHDVLESIRVSVSSAIFSTWFSQTHLAELSDSKERFFVQVGCSSSFVKNTIEARYFGLIQDALIKTLGKPCDLLFVVRENPENSSPKKPLGALFEEKGADNSLVPVLERAKVRAGFTFENFAVSSSNQMAWAASEAVSKTPGEAYNPLFIWGGVGVGKTHLMLAVGHTILSADPDAKILFCSAEEFTNDIVEGIRNKTTPAVRNKYRQLKVLLIDDIQFIAGKDTAQEEFFHTFNAVTSAHGQVVLTSDKPPSEISKLEERLKSRFEAGLIVDVAPPDFELRCAILQIKSKERGLEIPMDLIQMVAGNFESARQLQGFLVRLTSEAKLRKSEITQDLVESILNKKVALADRGVRANPNEVISAVSKYFSVGKRALLGDSRARPIARPRQILMYLLRRELGLPLEEVGRLVGNRDHTTVMHAVEKITLLLSADVQTREDILGIKNRI